jgi:hypothetical protein
MVVVMAMVLMAIFFLRVLVLDRGTQKRFWFQTNWYEGESPAGFLQLSSTWVVLNSLLGWVCCCAQ